MPFSGLDGELALSPLRPDDAEEQVAGEDLS